MAKQGKSGLSEIPINQSLQEAIKKAPEILADRMKKARGDLSKGLPEAKSGEVLSSRVTH